VSRAAGASAGDANAQPGARVADEIPNSPGVAPVAAVASAAPQAPARSRPSPQPRRSAGRPSPGAGVTGTGVLSFDDVPLRTRLRRYLLAPPTVLGVVMAVLALFVHRHRLGLHLSGGRLLPPESLSETWSSYLASWHPVGGGSAAPAPAALGVLAILGLPVGSPAVAVSLLLLGSIPLAGLAAYRATRALPAGRWWRALAAAGYAVLPPAIAGLAQGRLDVVVAHVLLPLVLAGLVAVLRGGATPEMIPGTDPRSAGWLSTAAATALGIAVIGAFAPLLHLMLVVLALVGFIVVPAPQVPTLRRAIGLFAVVLLPLGLLMPWPAVVVQRPAVLLHGVGAVVPEQLPGALRLLALDPGGAGTVPWTGGVVVLAALIALLTRPSRAMLPGAGVVLLGAAAVILLARFPMPPLAGGDPRPGFTGGVLLLAGCGLLWIVLAAGHPAARRGWVPAGWIPTRLRGNPWQLGSPSRLGGSWRRRTRSLPALGVGLLLLAAGTAGSGGPLTAGPPAGLPVLAPPLSAELARSNTSVLVIGAKGEPVRLTRSRTARFGDDDIAPLRATGARLQRIAAALRAGQPGETPAAIADVAATGVQFVVLPTPEQGARALAAAGALARPAPPTTDGRPVLRVVRPVPGAELLGPALAEQARTGAAPPIEPGVSGVLAPALPPRVAVQVAAGADGRLLVIAANDEPGWQATVNGRPVPVVRGWGHQVAVPVSGKPAEVRVTRSEVGRTALLLIEGALLLVVVGTALPSQRRLPR
jgi:hypothetical protein